MYVYIYNVHRHPEFLCPGTAGSEPGSLAAVGLGEGAASGSGLWDLGIRV